MIYDNFVKWLGELDLTTVDANPITFNLTDFEEVDDFTKSMFLAGRYLLKEDDIVVRYSKPYTEDKTDVIVRFQILRSKAKMFCNYLKNNDTKIACFLTSNKEIKEGIKFFNSLGVKGEDMVSLSSKEMDYTSMLKEGLENFNKYMVENGKNTVDSVLISISIEHDSETEVNYPMLSYDFVSSNGFSNFNETKAWVKSEILKIKE
jgi:hypothetical protein